MTAWILMFSVFALLVMSLLPKESKRMQQRWVWFLAFLAANLAWMVWDAWDEALGGMQWPCHVSWIPGLGFDGFFGLDGHNLWGVLWTLFVVHALAVLGMHWMPKWQQRHWIELYVFQMLFLAAVLTVNAISFVVLAFLIWVLGTMIAMRWGSAGQVLSTHWMLGLMGWSLLTIAVSRMSMVLGSSVWHVWVMAQVPLQEQYLYFACFSLGGLLLMPCLPWPSWWACFHGRIPVFCSVIFLGLWPMLLGGAWLWWVLPIVPDAVHAYGWLVRWEVMLVLVSLPFWILRQRELRPWLALVSMHQAAVVLLALLLPDVVSHPAAMDGVMIQLLAHAACFSALGMVLGIIVHRTHHQEMHLYGGLAHSMPHLTLWTMVFMAALSAAPGTLMFVGHWLVFQHSTQGSWMELGMFLGASWLSLAYIMVWLKIIFWGSVRGFPSVHDVQPRELCFLLCLALVLLGWGCFPAPVLDRVHSGSVWLAKSHRGQL